MPDGTEFAIKGEAQDESGAFGIAVALPAEDEAESPERAVAKDTATEVVGDVLGGGIVGGPPATTCGRRTTRGRAGTPLTVSLDVGTPVQVDMGQAHLWGCDVEPECTRNVCPL